MIVLLALIIIGLIEDLAHDPIQLLIPLAIFGTVFLLYKFPPGGSRRGKPPVRKTASSSRSKNSTRSRKPAPFRVIEGGKDDDNLPKYH
ncbi:hypothetical protein DNH61_22585 [Paenibacillus sambharensis]|uniref:Uncharacterized protein n=2 Tax=Paenibacillus sambharensis TaxID=1803190 RepID=A0A2W1LNN9_9BACL|nr:hypothetical protein DNH61_22585 [Paenibacillus sambharensis]